MNIVETCTCGGSIRLVGAPASLALEVASFRDAHDVCRQRKTREERDRETNEQLVQYAWTMKNPADDMPCPKCGGDKMRPTFGEGGVVYCHAPSSVVPATERIDLPPTTQFVPQDCCPSCGHDVRGRAQCAAFFGDGPESCPCTNIWHNHGES